MNRIAYLACCIMAFVINPDHGKAQTGVRLFLENDFFSPLAPNRDDNYTGGAKAEIIFAKPKLPALPFLLKNKLPREVMYQTIAFTGTAFTPQRLDIAEIVKDDRPYASVMAFSIGAQYRHTATPKPIHFGYELTGGKLGTPIPGRVQGQIHRHEIFKWVPTNRPDPLGWHNQVANGGAFFINLRLNEEHLLVQSKPRPHYYVPVRLSIRNSLNAGNYLINSTHGLRVNFFNKQYDFDHEIAPPYIGTIAKSKIFQSPRTFSFSLYAEPRVKLNIHNAGLTGKLLSKPSAHTIYTTTYASGLTPVLFEYEMGVVMRIYFLQLGVSLNGRSKEFAAQNKSMHNWGGIYIAVIGYR